MDERYQQEAEFGEDPILTDDEPVEDEIVLDEVPEEEEGDEYEEESPDSDGYNPEIKQRDKAQIRINRITKERYKAENRAKKAAADADYWRQKYELSSQLNLRQSDLNANARLEKARSALIAATEAGDAQAQADANIAIAAATSDLQEIGKERIRSEYEDRARQQYPAHHHEELDTEIAQDWVQENNDWINPQSKNFDEDLTRYIAAVDNQLGNELRAKNATHLIGSSEYIETLENYKNAYLNQRSQAMHQGQNTNQRGGLNMRQARGGASPVRGSSQTQYRSNRSSDLTPAERAMVESISHTGVTEETFRKAKMADLKRRRAEGERI
jgi:hypothetical protein